MKKNQNNPITLDDVFFSLSTLNLLFNSTIDDKFKLEEERNIISDKINKLNTDLENYRKLLKIIEKQGTILGI